MSNAVRRVATNINNGCSRLAGRIAIAGRKSSTMSIRYGRNDANRSQANEASTLQ